MGPWPTVAPFARFVAATAGFPAAATDGGDRSAAEIAQFRNLAQNDGSSLFEIDKSLRHVAPSFLTYRYVRHSTTKKDPSSLHIFVVHPAKDAILPHDSAIL